MRQRCSPSNAGTTGVTALVVSAEGKIRGRGYAEFRQHYPEPGWVEHLPEGIWQATLSAARQALAGGATVQAVGITNQRETLVVWDRRTLAAPRRAIVWQDRRTAALCARLREAGHEPRVTELTGLRLDPYFTATKLSWIAANDEATWAAITERQRGGWHGRLLSHRAADRRTPARDRRLQRVEDPAVRHRVGAVVGGALRAFRRADERVARGGAVLRGGGPGRS